MNTLIEDFQIRRSEVRRYIATLLFLQSGVEKKRTSRIEIKEKHEIDLKVYRAGSFLLLYNLMEASARQAIRYIYDSISSNNCNFNDLISSIKKQTLKDFKSNFKIENISNIEDISISIVNMSFNEKKILNGNVDAQTIRTLSEIYGFSAETDKETTHDGAPLYIIKSQRQNLSHGDMSFSDVGKNYTPKEIARIYKYSSTYMEEILKNIVLYAETKKFLNNS